MTTAEESARTDGAVNPPKGCVRALAPDGKTQIWVKDARAPGPWFRVKHQHYGHRCVQAATEDEALKKFFSEFSPGTADDLAWCKESMRMNAGRISRLPGSEPPAEAKAPVPAPAKKTVPAG